MSWHPFALVERRMSRVMREPVSIRSAASVIVVAAAVTTLASGLLMRVIDHKEFDSIGLGLWWAVQTVTTVGYGDVVPRDVGGRLVATLVMLEGTALLAIITAAITSTFVERARAERESRGARKLEEDKASLQTSLDDLSARLERVEALLTKSTTS